MTIKEAILAMPVKKAAVLAACFIIVILFLVQALFINQVISIIDRSVTQFERIAKSDKAEVDKDFREFDEQRAYDRQITEHNSDRLRLSITASPQEEGCYHLKNIKRFEAMQTFAYVKHSKAARNNIQSELLESREAIKMLNEKNEFNPTLCKPVAL